MAKKVLAPLDLTPIPGGTAPLVVTSTTVVTNLNADLLDGQHGAYYLAWANFTGKPTTLAGYGITDGLVLNDTIMGNNAFGGRRLYIANIDNALHAADKRYTVTVTTHLQTYLSESYPKLNPAWVASYSVSGSGTSFTVTGAPSAIVVYNGTTICVLSGSPSTQYQYTYSGGVLTFGATVSGAITVYPDHTVPQYLDSPVESTLSSATPFDGTYESMVTAPIGSYLKIRIMASSDGNTSFPGYPYGSFFLSYYYTSTGSGASQYRVYNRNLHAHTIGWKVSSFTDFVGNATSSGYIQSVADELNFGRTIIEFIVHSHASRPASVSELEWKLTRPAMAQLPVLTNYGANKLYYALTLGAATTTSVSISPTGLIDLNGLSGEPRFRLANTALSSGVDFVLSTTGTVYGIFDRNGSAAWALQFAASTRAATFANTVTATGFTGPLTGNATTATTLQNARTIGISGPITGTATSFNGSANITIPVTSLNLADAAVTGTLGAARMPALTGDVTTTVGTVATTIAAGAVTLAKMASMATASFLGRSTAGTGAPEVLSAATARTTMGATTAGSSFFTLANPGAITFPRINADNSVSALDAAAFRTAIGAGTSSTVGTVTSVNLTSTTGLTASGGPVTGSGSLTYTLSANLQSWSDIAPASKVTNDNAGSNTLALGWASNEFNIRVDGVTRQVVTTQEAQTITGAKTFSAGVTSSNSQFVGSAAIAAMGPSGTGQVLLRPNGIGSATGQLQITPGTISWNGNTLWHAGNLSPVTTNTAQDIAGVKKFTDNVFINTGVQPALIFQNAGVSKSALYHDHANARQAFARYDSGGSYVQDAIQIEDAVGGTIRITGAVVASGDLVSTAGVVLDAYGNVRNMIRTTSAFAPGHVFVVTSGTTISTGGAAGAVYSVYNDSASAITLTQGSGLTLRLSGTATTGNRTLAARGFATFWCNSTTEYIISGDVT